ncbi:winged helix-turn-helix transcriptional regulator [Geobacter chapellei]|uniref:Winged helix-turn-helix transcriptional regulator n=2 Tax=Pelotalea chapellei TaxID=44671 RepID=A0ABS5U531_9BACT|nr:winged helix-turn-helix transcriptional regulator [Pelotalea chapellei]
MEADPFVTQKEIAGQLNLSYAGIRYHTDKLKAKGILQRSGGKKAGHWKVIR